MIPKTCNPKVWWLRLLRDLSERWGEIYTDTLYFSTDGIMEHPQAEELEKLERICDYIEARIMVN